MLDVHLPSTDGRMVIHDEERLLNIEDWQWVDF